MTLFEQQGLAAVVLVVTALFVSGGMPVSPKWHRRFKAAAIGLFILGLVVVMAEIARWASSGGRLVNLLLVEYFVDLLARFIYA